ncbi:outer membrane protein TolC [Hydrotalea sandarakina]|jgi:outer membrane protein TolC|uniref:Outer membrane protein TolC n=2 Tax=Hydrotalea sandarakina TaxID=1004304 RepID=A0A2W7SCD0_9BACT|nr:outer membrane protein TolC [Hydrotalea sandarakina]
MFSFNKKSIIGSMLLVVWLGSIVTVFGQTTPSYFSLPQLTDSALHFYPSVMSKQALVASARAGIMDAKHAALPSLDVHDQVTTSTANGVTGTFLPLGIAIPTAGGITANNNWQPAAGNIGLIYSQYELYNFGLNKARVMDAIANARFAESDYAKETYLLKLNVANYYLALLKNIQQLGVEQDNVRRYETLFTVIRAQAASGLKPGVDSSLAKAELAKARINYNNQSDLVLRLREQLSMLTGISIDRLNVDTAVGRFNDLIIQNNFSSEVDTLNNPLVDYYRQIKNRYIAQGKLIQKTYQPKIYLAGGFWGRGSSIDYQDQYKAFASGLGYQRFNYSVGLAFTYNLFDGIHRKDQMTVNKFATQSSDYDLQEQKLYLSNSYQKAMASIDIIQKNLLEIPIQLQSARDAYHQKVAQYNAGLINLIDLTNSAFVLYRSQTDYIQTITNWLQANLDKSAAAGTIDSFIQTIK